MAAIQPGGTITANTVEGQIMQCLTYLQLCEQDASKNPRGVDYVSIGYRSSGNSHSFTASWAIPVSQASSQTGNRTIVPIPYLIDNNFIGGGSLNSEEPAAYLMELVTLAQNLEADTNKNPSGSNNITDQISGDDLVWSGSVSLPVEMSQNSQGNTIFTTKEFLL